MKKGRQRSFGTRKAPVSSFSNAERGSDGSAINKSTPTIVEFIAIVSQAYQDKIDEQEPDNMATSRLVILFETS